LMLQSQTTCFTSQALNYFAIFHVIHILSLLEEYVNLKTSIIHCYCLCSSAIHVQYDSNI